MSSLMHDFGSRLDDECVSACLLARAIFVFCA